ncbi:zinc finger protein RFP-like [Numenius arquata]|uniref:zinc finger protein RFP-like n=1 Tax=Numenius arquata TaxID=31919 RepID=UPI003D307687
MSIHCGHRLCQSCITQKGEGLTTNFSCPQCRKTESHKSHHPNSELKNVQEVEGKKNLCEKHQEPLKLFCQDEKKLICVVCDRSKERTEAAKQKVVRTYRKLHETLEKEESSFLAQLEKLATEIRKAHEEIRQKLLEETTRLGTLTGEMERTYQQPDLQLPKDIGTTLSRGQRKTLSHSLDISPELEKKFCDFMEKTTAIEEALEKFQDFLEFELPLKTQMTLDPKTANARLYL